MLFKVILQGCLLERAISQIKLLQAKSKKLKIKFLNCTTDGKFRQKKHLLLKYKLLSNYFKKCLSIVNIIMS